MKDKGYALQTLALAKILRCTATWVRMPFKEAKMKNRLSVHVRPSTGFRASSAHSSQSNCGFATYHCSYARLDQAALSRSVALLLQAPVKMTTKTSAPTSAQQKGRTPLTTCRTLWLTHMVEGCSSMAMTTKTSSCSTCSALWAQCQTLPACTSGPSMLSTL